MKNSLRIHKWTHNEFNIFILGVLTHPRARVFFSGTNLLTWAKYDQYDPELTGTVGFDIPPLKTFSFGLEIGI